MKKRTKFDISMAKIKRILKDGIYFITHSKKRIYISYGKPQHLYVNFSQIRVCYKLHIPLKSYGTKWAFSKEELL